MRHRKKIPDLLSKVRLCIEAGRFLDTLHATRRQAERSITRQEMLFVLQYGFHEYKKDRFDERYQAWNYAIRGKTVDGRLLRVIVSFEAQDMVIITAIEL